MSLKKVMAEIRSSRTARTIRRYKSGQSRHQAERSGDGDPG